MKIQLLINDNYLKSEFGLYRYSICEVIRERIVSVTRKYKSCIREFYIKAKHKGQHNHKDKEVEIMIRHFECRVLSITNH